ncbi:MAG: MraY family glycosyltransferase [Myxococcaceae bacterium]
MTLSIAFLTALIAGATLTLVVRNLAHRFAWYDTVRGTRKLHAAPVSRLGGLALIGGFFAPLVALLWVDSSVGQSFSSEPRIVAALFGGTLVIAALGLYDDLRGAGASKKFIVQVAVALGLWALGFRIHAVASPFGGDIALGYFALPLTVFWIVGVINAMNLIDGLDGLAGGVAFIVAAANFVLAFTRGEALMSLMMAALAGALLGFLLFNFNPASIFMGDTGSMFLGFVLAAVSVRTSQKSGTAVALLVPIIALGLPIMDTLLAMARRTVLGRSMFSADKEHIHHRLMSRLMLSQRRAVLVLYGLCCVFAATAVALSFANGAQSIVLLAGIGLVVTVLMRKLGYLNLGAAPTVQRARQRNIALRTIVRASTDAVESSRTTQDMWTAAKPLAEAMSASFFEMYFKGSLKDPGEGVRYEVRRPGEGPLLRWEAPLEHQGQVWGTLCVHWQDGRLEVDRDEELALELLADAAAKTLFGFSREPLPANVLSLRK